jgi:hypothetical protein
VSGTSCIKWHLSHSIHAEHRGRTPKCPISNHRVEYNYSTLVSSIRIGIDKNNNLAECPIEFEVSQEFSMVAAGGGGGRDEKIILGVVRLNLSEYVEESEVLARELAAVPSSPQKRHFRRRSAGPQVTDTKAASVAKLSGDSAEEGGGAGGGVDDDDDQGIVRRYLIQDSKINSTLKIGILMVQVDGERNFVAPPLKTAPVFGGIAGIMPGEPVEADDAGRTKALHFSPSSLSIKEPKQWALLPC